MAKTKFGKGELSSVKKEANERRLRQIEEAKKRAQKKKDAMKKKRDKK